MTALLYILPIIFVILAIAAFFVNLDEPKGKIIFMVIAVILLITLVGNEIAVHMKVQKADTLDTEVDRLNDWKTGQIARMNTILASLSNETRSEKEKLAGLATLGWSSTNPLIQEAFAADEARKELLSFIPPARNKAVIENLPVNVDKMLLSFALEEMGFIVSANQAQEKYTDDDTDNSEVDDEDEDSDEEDAGEESDNEEQKAAPVEPEVNALFFGHLVRNNDIKLALYTLLRAGIQIRHVRVFRKKTNENARHIKLVYSKSYIKRTAFSVAKIKKTKAFKR